MNFFFDTPVELTNKFLQTADWLSVEDQRLIPGKPTIDYIHCPMQVHPIFQAGCR
jgi:hypothetical protein